MSAYALGLLEHPELPVHPQVLDYLRRIETTLAPFAGHFLVHGAPVDVREGTGRGAVVLIGFPDLGAAEAWYDSPAYRAIRSWRADHIAGGVLLVEGVDPDHLATDLIAGLSARPERA